MKRHKPILAILIVAGLIILTGSPGFAAPLPQTGEVVYMPLIANGQKPPQALVEVRSNHFAYVTSTNKLHIVGEVQNNTTGAIHLIQVNARIKNGSGQELTSKSAFVFPTALPAGEKSCFDINLDAPVGWVTYSLDPATYTTGGTPFTNLVLLNPAGTLFPSGNYAITGQIRNDYAVTMNIVGPVGTLYDTNGKVIGCKLTTVTGNNLTAGQTSEFNLVFIDRDNFDAGSYHLMVSSTSSPP